MEKLSKRRIKMTKDGGATRITGLKERLDKMNSKLDWILAGLQIMGNNQSYLSLVDKITAEMDKKVADVENLIVFPKS